MFLKLLLYFCILFSFDNVVFSTTEHNFNVEVNEFKPINEKSDWVAWNTLRLKKVGRNELVVTGDITIKRNIIEDQLIIVQVFTYKNKRRGLSLYTMKKTFCSYIKEENSMYEGFRKVSNLPEANCPFPKGDYTINNYEVDLTFLPSTMPTGNYLIVASLFDKGVVAAELQADISLT